MQTNLQPRTQYPNQPNFEDVYGPFLERLQDILHETLAALLESPSRTGQRPSETLRYLHKYLQENLSTYSRDEGEYRVSTTIPLILNYRGFKHVFLFSPTARTLNAEDDYGTFPLPATTWTNFPFPEGSHWLDSASASPIPIFFRATNEVIP